MNDGTSYMRSLEMITCKKDASIANESLIPKRKYSPFPTISPSGKAAANSEKTKLSN